MTLRARDLLFLLVWATITLILGILCLPALVSRRATQAVAHYWAGITLALVKKISGINSHIRGYHYISRIPAIYAAKHQSAWDTLMLWSVLRSPAFVLKRELYLIPIFGWYLWRSGQIAINRRAGTKAVASMVAQAKYYIEQGRPIVIFPEGTRKAVGAAPQYKKGIAYVSAEIVAPVVPVALNAGKCWPRSLLLKRSGSAVIEFLPAMPPAGNAKDAWLSDLEGRIETATAKLVQQE